MPAFSGEFQYLDESGNALQGGPCQVAFDAECLVLTPGTGAAFSFDLGDLDAVVPSDYELALTLYTGKRVLLSQFGKAYQNLAHDLLEAYRHRSVDCLLLEDLNEVARFDGFVRRELPAQAASGPAEIRFYESNLAVLPASATGFQWRLADIEELRFDSSAYAVILESCGERLIITKLAKRTEEFLERLKDLQARVNEKSARALRSIFPFLVPEQSQQVSRLMSEGRAVSLARLRAIHSKTEPALFSAAVDAALKPYVDDLRGRTRPEWLYAGIKLVRPEDEETEEPGDRAGSPSEEESSEEIFGKDAESPAQKLDDVGAASAPGDGEAILYWFFFPLAPRAGALSPANVVAWEATSASGRATYFFRLVSPEQGPQLTSATSAPDVMDTAIRQLARGLALLNFRRAPIYLPDDSLELQPRYRRYAIACRRIAELRRLRTLFLGRAIHTSLAAWQKQVAAILARAEI